MNVAQIRTKHWIVQRLSLIHILNSKLDIQNEKFDVQKNSLNELKNQINIQNDKFDELKSEIQEINKHCENTKVEFTNKLNQVETRLDDSIHKTDVKFNEVDSQISNFEKRINAVSYTHLDVYKRQPPIHTLLST